MWEFDRSDPTRATFREKDFSGADPHSIRGRRDLLFDDFPVGILTDYLTITKFEKVTAAYSNHLILTIPFPARISIVATTFVQVKGFISKAEAQKH